MKANLVCLLQCSMATRSTADVIPGCYQGPMLYSLMSRVPHWAETTVGSCSSCVGILV